MASTKGEGSQLHNSMLRTKSRSATVVLARPACVFLLPLESYTYTLGISIFTGIFNPDFQTAINAVALSNKASIIILISLVTLVHSCTADSSVSAVTRSV